MAATDDHAITNNTLTTNLHCYCYIPKSLELAPVIRPHYPQLSTLSLRRRRQRGSVATACGTWHCSSTNSIVQPTPSLLLAAAHHGTFESSSLQLLLPSGLHNSHQLHKYQSSSSEQAQIVSPEQAGRNILLEALWSAIPSRDFP